MTALLVIAAAAVAFYVGAVVGVVLRRWSIEDAYREGKEAGLRQARRERLEADAEMDAVLAEWRQVG
jgi:hypothetical protein